MKDILKKYMSLLVSGLVLGYNIYPINIKFLYTILLVLVMMLLYAQPTYNVPLYIEGGFTNRDNHWDDGNGA